MKENKLKGIPAASGIAIGPAYVLGKEEVVVNPYKISENDIPIEIARFEDALIETRKEILDIKRKISNELGDEHAQIFDAHILVLEDRVLIEEVITNLKKEKLCVEYIFSKVLKKYVGAFARMEDEYLRERTADINDVGKRIIRKLLGKEQKLLENVGKGVIVVAHDLSPSDTAAMFKKNIAAFITDIGGRTSHTAIMAKSLEIPAVVGLEEATIKIKPDDILIVNGRLGEVIINPDEKLLSEYKEKKEKVALLEQDLRDLKDLEAETTDGRKISIGANIELPEEVPSLIEHGSEGIGLYRTEYFYMNRKDLPSEDEQFESYKQVAEAILPHSAVIRTLDLGGDKFISKLQVPGEMHSFLGWRAIRFCLARPEIFKTQLRAILRASAFGKLKIMYPMISGIEELKAANKILNEVKKDLSSKKIKFDERLEVGAMIEVPSAALTADILAQEADFFSIGTNDLIQYALAVDRTDEKVAYLYEPAHPAVLRLIKTIIEAGHNAGIWVGMCGEMSGDPEFALLLLGMGLDEMSMPSLNIPKIKYVIRSVSLKTAQKIVEKALSFTTSKGVEDYVRVELNKLVGEIY